ncbi:transglycosylase SLT domain-containing protein [Nocardia brasiliensis]|uniref:transglycosylase SLT domain-containing protein n=1 Tax=Nocardia brasiliensis TaxID=37326 RepID=UPI00245674F0|nr:transglycosylase SLT domain-containing protein [Nocardia brasiliensis]
MTAIAAEHYRVVELYCPGAASPGLRALIEAAEQGMQTSVDLLGAENPGLAPDLIGLLRENGLIDERDQAVIIDEHSGAVAELEGIKSRLGELDKGVKASTTVVGGIPEETWGKIKPRIAELNGVLVAAPAPPKDQKYLSAAVESKLQGAVQSAVKDVHRYVMDADIKMRQQADSISGRPFPVPRNGGEAPVAPVAASGAAPMGSGPMGPGPMPVAPSSSARSRPSGLSRAAGGRGGYDGRYTDQLSETTSDPTGRRRLSRQEQEVYIGKALDALGITDPVARANWTRGYLVLIARESGGDTGAINLTDSNAAAGHPSQGLTQTIPSTFRSYHVAGTSSSITDPTANIAASMNYVMQRHNVARDGSNLTVNVQQADATRSPRGY